MSPTPIARPTGINDLVEEIHQTLIEARERRRTKAEPLHERYRREPETAFDATVALLIRHRLRVDVDRARRAVKAAQGPDLDAFARGCAQHILDIADEQGSAPDVHPQEPDES